MNNLPPLPLVDGCLFVDNSGFIEGTSTCYRYLEYRNLHLRVKAEEKPALNFGTALHTALEYRYVKAKNERPEPWLDEEVATMLTSHFNDHPCPEGDFRTLNWCQEVFRRYNERYTIEEFSLLSYDEPIDCPHCSGSGCNALDNCVWCSGTGKRSLMVEMSFALPLFTVETQLPDTSGLTPIPVFYCGRIDLPILLDGSIYIMDHKTTSYMGQSFWDEQRLSSQHKGYCWAFQELTGKKVKGWLPNGIRTLEPPQYVINGTAFKGKKLSPAEWWTQSFQRERFFVKDGELDEWKTNTISMIEEFFFHYQRGYMPMKTKFCTRYGRCPYYEVCTTEIDGRGMMLASGLFADNIWTPLKQPVRTP